LVNEQSGVQRAFRNLTRATIALYLVLAVLVAASFVDRTVQVNRVEKTADVTHAALCSLREDLAERVATSEQFLAENPDGIPGLPAKTIQTSIDSQKRTIETLSVLECSP